MTTDTERRNRHQRPPYLADLEEDLLWPRLLRVWALAIRPDRLGIAFMAVLVMLAIGSAPPKNNAEQTLVERTLALKIDGARTFVHGIVTVDRKRAFDGVSTLKAIPGTLVSEFGWAVPLLGIPVIIVAALGAVAIARSAACDFAAGVSLPWPQAVGFSLGRWRSALGAVFGPLILIGVLGALMAGAGWVLFSLPWVNVAGGVFYFVFLLVAFLVALILIGYVLASPLLIGSVACESTDAIDAIQRSYAYVLGRPLRLVAYGAILAATGLVATAIVYMVADETVDIARRASTVLVSPSDALVVPDGDSSTPPPDLGAWHQRATSWLITLWTSIPPLLVLAFAFSFVSSGCAVLYLLVRQVNDGQDWAELWLPGMVGGTVTEAWSRPDPVAAPGTSPAPAGDRTGATGGSGGGATDSFPKDPGPRA